MTVEAIDADSYSFGEENAAATAPHQWLLRRAEGVARWRVSDADKPAGAPQPHAPLGCAGSARRCCAATGENLIALFKVPIQTYKKISLL